MDTARMSHPIEHSLRYPGDQGEALGVGVDQPDFVDGKLVAQS